MAALYIVAWVNCCLGATADDQIAALSIVTACDCSAFIACCHTSSLDLTNSYLQWFGAVDT